MLYGVDFTSLGEKHRIAGSGGDFFGAREHGRVKRIVEAWDNNAKGK